MALNARENLLAWQVVQQLIRFGEITLAARKLNLDPPQASRLLRSLEQELGFLIFDRKTRPFKVTQQGEQILNNMELLLENRKQLQSVCRRVSSGELSIKINLGVATDSDAEIIFALVQDYERIDPNLQISILNHASLEAIHQRKIHIGYLPYLAKRNDFLCVPVTTVFMFSLASPSYLEKFGTPLSPADLTEHITLQRNDADYPVTTGLWKHHHYQSISPKKTYFLDNRVALEMAIKGKGIALDVPISLAQEAIKKKLVIPTINGWHRQCWHYSLVCNYSVLKEYQALGNFIEWSMMRLQTYENAQWQSIYKLCKEGLPIFDKETPEDHATDLKATSS